MVRDFLRGCSAPFRAMRMLLADRRLRGLAARPFFINALLVVTAIPFGVWLATDWVAGLIAADGLMVAVARLVLQILAALAAIALVAVAALLAATVIAAPYNSRLSACVEAKLLTAMGRESQAVEQTFVAEAARSLGTAVWRLLVFLICYPPILLMQFIPGLGFLLYPILSFLYGAFVLAFDFSDYAFERNLSPVRANLKFIMRRKALYLGFGGIMLVLAPVPVVNLLLVPIGVPAATILYVEEVHRPRG